jgi:tetratricopeptide (TPR) repeat protein
MFRWLAALALGGCLCAQTARDLRVQRVAPPLPDKRARWAVIVGVSSYKYAPPQAQLKFAHRDAEDFARLLRSSEGGGFPPGNVRLLTDESATIGGIRAAIHSWLPGSVGPNDVVYFFFAGHAVTEERGDSYFVAHDSDPQNLHATGIPFKEVNDALTNKMKAASVVLFADACHAGGIGWTADPAAVPAATQKSLEAMGASDRSFLKMLASRPSERSFEDARWGGGHGIFTFSVLTALRGAADRDRDGFVRVSELIDYVSTNVPKQTEEKQNPRVAGNFDAAMPVASVSVEVRKQAAPAPAMLRLTGPPNTVVYVDREFRGSIRPTGDLLIETDAGSRVLSVDLPGAEQFEQSLTVKAGQNTVDLEKSPEFALLRLKASIRSGNIVGAGGAWEQYRAQTFAPSQAPAASALMMGALEDTGMECVSDYVQSTTNALKRPMFLRSAEALKALATLRPGDASLNAKALFCQARAQIAANEFPQAIESLNRSLAIDAEFACSYNALGVALARVGRMDESRRAFETAARLTPQWALPPLEIARQLINAGDLRGAAPQLERAAKLNPKAIGIYWSLARVHRLLNNNQDFVRVANATLAIDRNYAPIYAELGMFFETLRDPVKAAQAYDSYLLLAPNFADSVEVRKRVQAIRSPAPPPPQPRKPPTLRREGDKKR